ncbi:MAG TPA: hypothetical protein PK788_08630 [Gemmatimonadaceae bacterium]|nr:hypothetical protein [Gemmatimonadaceae bacterium]
MRHAVAHPPAALRRVARTGYLSSVNRTVLSPNECAALVPELAATRNPNVWVYRYTHPTTSWTLSIATHAPPGSGKLSLGGFRIAPLERTESPGFTTERESIALAMGMEEKVHWSRVIKVGGPLALRDLTRVVGGKCVLAPTAESRVGNPRDAEMLIWAAECLNDCERHAGIHITTGQDLGHGKMHDGAMGSLEFLNARFAGSVVADTSVPTGEGNYQILHGMLRAFGLPLERATVGLIGCGNIGMHIIKRLAAHAGVTILACESREERRAELEAMGIRTWGPERKLEFLALAMDALVVNAAGGTLDATAIAACARNARLQVICGSENLVMPDHHAGVEALRAAHKVYAPTELGGMMGYLTAVEQYLAVIEGQRFAVATMLDAAQRLEVAGYETTARIVAGGHAEDFETAVTALYA